jgi:RimJ/RimL family protein N-acetyltransferase
MDLSVIDNVEGPNLKLRLIKPDDAAYVHSLRTNPLYNNHLSEVTGTIDDQRQWIENYKARESTGQEFYYVIERKDGTRCGLVRLYDIEAACFTWGSWILDENKPSKAALESALLIYDIGFERIGCDYAVFDVRSDNTHTLAFHRRFGAEETDVDELNVYFYYARSKFDTDRPIYFKLLNK